MQTGQLVRVTQGISGQEPNGDSLLPYLSADGRLLLYTSSASNLVEGDTDQRSDVFLYDAQTGLTNLVSTNLDGHPAGGAGFGISGDGKRVLYLDINGATPRGLFVKDLQTELFISGFSQYTGRSGRVIRLGRSLRRWECRGL